MRKQILIERITVKLNNLKTQLKQNILDSYFEHLCVQKEQDSCTNLDFLRRVQHLYDVLRRHVGLDVVHLREHEARSVAGEVGHAAADLVAHIGRRAAGQHLLRVAAAAPEADVLAEVALLPA